jgi:hypothetical protein
MRKTMRNVTIVVPVFTTSCQVSLKPNAGPVMAQMRRTATARANVAGRPDARAVRWAKRVNHGFIDIVVPGFMRGLLDAAEAVEDQSDKRRVAQG